MIFLELEDKLYTIGIFSKRAYVIKSECEFLCLYLLVH